MYCPLPQRCSKRLLTLWRLYAVFILMLVSAVGILGAVYSDVFILVPLAVSVSSITIYQLVYLPVLWSCRTYTRNRGILRIEKGFILKRTTVVPRSQLQFISIRRLPLERILGISTLIFHTTGGNVYLPGLENDTAAQLRENFSRGFEN